MTHAHETTMEHTRRMMGFDPPAPHIVYDDTEYPCGPECRDTDGTHTACPTDGGK